jgi:hypothetical protein
MPRDACQTAAIGERSSPANPSGARCRPAADRSRDRGTKASAPPTARRSRRGRGPARARHRCELGPGHLAADSGRAASGGPGPPRSLPARPDLARAPTDGAVIEESGVAERAHTVHHRILGWSLAARSRCRRRVGDRHCGDQPQRSLRWIDGEQERLGEHDPAGDQHHHRTYAAGAASPPGRAAQACQAAWAGGASSAPGSRPPRGPESPGGGAP